MELRPRKGREAPPSTPSVSFTARKKPPRPHTSTKASISRSRAQAPSDEDANKQDTVATPAQAPKPKPRGAAQKAATDVAKRRTKSSTTASTVHPVDDVMESENGPSQVVNGTSSEVKGRTIPSSRKVSKKKDQSIRKLFGDYQNAQADKGDTDAGTFELHQSMELTSTVTSVGDPFPEDLLDKSLIKAKRGMGPLTVGQSDMSGSVQSAVDEFRSAGGDETLAMNEGQSSQLISKEASIDQRTHRSPQVKTFHERNSGKKKTRLGQMMEQDSQENAKDKTTDKVNASVSFEQTGGSGKKGGSFCRDITDEQFLNGKEVCYSEEQMERSNEGAKRAATFAGKQQEMTSSDNAEVEGASVCMTDAEEGKGNSEEEREMPRKQEDTEGDHGDDVGKDEEGKNDEDESESESESDDLVDDDNAVHVADDTGQDSKDGESSDDDDDSDDFDVDEDDVAGDVEEEMAKAFIKCMKVQVQQSAEKSVPISMQEDTDKKEGASKGNGKVDKKFLGQETNRLTSTSSRFSSPGLLWCPNTGLPMPKSGSTSEKKSELVKREGVERLWKKERKVTDGLVVPPVDPRELNKLARKQKDNTAGPKWFNLSAPTITPELKKELQILKLRKVIDPKRHYKAEDSKGLPKHFQIGTVVAGPAEFYSGRLTKKEQKSSLADELLADSALSAYRKRKYLQIQDQKQAGGKTFWKKKKSKRTPAWAKV